MRKAQRTWGLRFGPGDASFLLICAIATVLLWQSLPQLAPIVPLACGAFFLFCNVFRIARKLELIWAGLLLLNVGALLALNAFSWLLILGIQIPLTGIVLWIEIRSPRYHGIFATQLNPHLQRYLQAGTDDREQSKSKNEGS